MKGPLGICLCLKISELGEVGGAPQHRAERAEGAGVICVLDPVAAGLGDFWGVYHSLRLPTGDIRV